ncbi:MAG: tetratricopeptide repeat protein [Candidatus Hydrogenedentota bacterium]
MRALNWIVITMLLVAAAPLGTAQFSKGEPAPCIEAADINEDAVDSCENMARKQPYLAMYFFFEPQSGQDIALKLRLLDLRYGKDKMDIIALGFEEDAEQLKAFARQLDLRYHIISRDAVEAAWVQEITTLPLVLFVRPDEKPVIEEVLRGGGETSAMLLKEVAENLYQKRKTEALEVADVALSEGEPEKAVRELKGYILVAEGKLEDAVGEFTTLDDPAGLAKVAIERGEYEEAVSLADAAPENPHAKTLKGQALMNQGKVDEAATVVEEAAAYADNADWKQSEAANANGRIAQEKGDDTKAMAEYERAVELDPYNVVALSNESVVLANQGKTEEAKAKLEQAASRRDDELVRMLLAELRARDDSARLARIQEQIRDLAAWAEKAKDEPRDDWTTRPMVVSFLAGNRGPAVFFPRAGTDSAVRHAIAAAVRERSNVTVVDRENLDLILQEQQLSALADPETAIQPGKFKVARYLSFVDFDSLTSDPFVFVRVTDTETGEVVLHHEEGLPPGKVEKPVRGIVEKLLDFCEQQEIRGLVAAVLEEDQVLLNLTKAHGVSEGMEFAVVEEGEPITAGGRVIAYRQRPIAKVAVTGFDEETGLAVAGIEESRGDVVVQKEMKLRSGG